VNAGRFAKRFRTPFSLCGTLLQAGSPTAGVGPLE